MISQLIMASISRAFGTIMAAPILAITVILIAELYAKRIHHVPEDKGKLVITNEITFED